MAQVLAERYGLRVLDNHLSVDPALRLFDFGTPEFGHVVERIRVTLLRAAARAGLDVVSTFVYAHLLDDAHLDTLIAASEDSGVDVTLVQLTPSDVALEDRVGASSRAGTMKMTDPRVLRRLLIEFDLRTPARSDDLVIDNTTLPATAAAQLIADHVGLVPQPRAPPTVRSERAAAGGESGVSCATWSGRRCLQLVVAPLQALGIERRVGHHLPVGGGGHGHVAAVAADHVHQPHVVVHHAEPVGRHHPGPRQVERLLGARDVRHDGVIWGRRVLVDDRH